MTKFAEEVKKLEYEWRSELDINNIEAVELFWCRVFQCKCNHKLDRLDGNVDAFTKINNMLKWLEHRKVQLWKSNIV